MHKHVDSSMNPMLNHGFGCTNTGLQNVLPLCNLNLLIMDIWLSLCHKHIKFPFDRETVRNVFSTLTCGITENRTSLNSHFRMPLRSIFLCLWIKTWECLTNNYVQEFPLQSKRDIHESQMVTRAHKSYHKIIHLPIFPLWPWIQMTGNSLNKRNMCTLFGLLLFRSCIGEKAFRIKLIIKKKYDYIIEIK